MEEQVDKDHSIRGELLKDENDGKPEDEYTECPVVSNKKSLNTIAGTHTKRADENTTQINNDTSSFSRDSFRELGAEDVVAPGEHDWELQMPSPVYCVECVDDDHIILAAGGGGRRFGMINTVVLLNIRRSLGTITKANYEREILGNCSCTEINRPAHSKQNSTLAKSIVHKCTTGETLSAFDKNGASGRVESGADTRNNMEHNANENSSALWSFAGALDLGNSVPWCGSKFLPYKTYEYDVHSHEEHTNDASETKAPPRKTDSVYEKATMWTEKQKRTLHGLHGFFALSSVSTFTLLGVFHAARGETTPQDTESMQSHSQQAQSPQHERHNHTNSQKQSFLSRYTIRRLACVSIPSDPINADKKPIALIKHALIVSDDENTIRIYSLPSLVGDEGAVIMSVLNTESYKPISPLALWSVPSRVNDLHANRINLARTRLRFRHANEQLGTSKKRLHCTALILDYVIIAAALQDKSVRVTLYRQHHRSLNATQTSRESGLKTDKSSAHIRPSSQQELIRNESHNVNAGCTIHHETGTTSMQPLRIYDATVLNGAACGLAFSLMPSSFRLVRIFAIEDMTRDMISQHRQELVHRRLGLLGIHNDQTSSPIALPKVPYETNLDTCQVQPAAAGQTEAETENTLNRQNMEHLRKDVIKKYKDTDTCASLMVVAYDCQQNQSYMIQFNITANIAFTQDEVNKFTQLKLQMHNKGDNKSPPWYNTKTKGEHESKHDLPTLNIDRMQTNVEAVIDDCITCISHYILPENTLKINTSNLTSCDTNDTDTEVTAPHKTEYDVLSAHNEHTTLKLERNNINIHKNIQGDVSNRLTQYFDNKPQHWIVGTVEGWIAMIIRDNINHSYRLQHVRPSKNKSTRARAPPLHKEPISSVTVTQGKKVISTDIAQHVVISTLTHNSILRTNKMETRKVASDDNELFPSHISPLKRISQRVTKQLHITLRNIIQQSVNIFSMNIIILITLIITLYSHYIYKKQPDRSEENLLTQTK